MAYVKMSQRINPTLFDKDEIIRFYSSVNFNEFKALEEERNQEIEKIAFHNRNTFLLKTNKLLPLMAIVAEKLRISKGLDNKGKLFVFTNDDEKLAYFINVIDPSLDILKIYETSNNTTELINEIKNKYSYFDKTLLKLEVYYNNRFNKLTEDDIWEEIEKKNR